MRSARPNLARSSDLGSGFFGGKKAKDSAYMMRARAVALARYAVDDVAILVRGCGWYVPSRGGFKGWGATAAWRLGDALNASCRWSRARLSAITLQAKSQPTSPSTVHGTMLCTLHHGALLNIFFPHLLYTHHLFALRRLSFTWCGVGVVTTWRRVAPSRRSLSDSDCVSSSDAQKSFWTCFHR